MIYKTTLIKLYHLLVNVDGNVNEKEVAASLQMIKKEEISEVEFNRVLDSLIKRTPSVVYGECLEELRRFSHEDQVRCLAWLSIIANADGFMDKMEWHFIYKLYNNELHLRLDDVMKMQKELIGLKEKDRSPLMAAVL